MELEPILIFVLSLVSEIVRINSVQIKVGHIQVFRKHPKLRECVKYVLPKIGYFGFFDKYNSYIGGRISTSDGTCKALGNYGVFIDAVGYGNAYFKYTSIKEDFQPPMLILDYVTTKVLYRVGSKLTVNIRTQDKQSTKKTYYEVILTVLSTILNYIGRVHSSNIRLSNIVLYNTGIYLDEYPAEKIILDEPLGESNMVFPAGVAFGSYNAVFSDNRVWFENRFISQEIPKEFIVDTTKICEVSFLVEKKSIELHVNGVKIGRMMHFSRFGYNYRFEFNYEDILGFNNFDKQKGVILYNITVAH